MGIALSEINGRRFDVYCDGPGGEFEALNLTNARACGEYLHAHGWTRGGYSSAFKAYLWYCPKCKVKRVTQ